MTRPIKTPRHKLRRQLAEFSRAIVPVRQTGGSAFISIPKAIRTAMDITIGDRLLLEFDPTEQTITLTKDSEGNRQRALDRNDNVRQLNNLYQLVRKTPKYGSPEWCRGIERWMLAMVQHLKGEKLEKVKVPLPAGMMIDDGDDDNDESAEETKP